jgi:hypothetical protein
VGAERRGADRFLCDLEPYCREQGAGRGEWLALGVENLSSTGIGLVTPHRLRQGTILVIRLASRTRGVSRPVVVRIVHSTTLDDGTWLTGGEFVRRLSDEALRELLDDGSTASPSA